MEKHKCKLCFRSFSNGRALGGHMRSHMMNLPIPPKHEDAADSASSRSEQHFRRETENDDEEEEDKSLCYGLRENPKRSVKLVDPENLSTTMMMIVQDQNHDRESESESSRNPTRRRSKRSRRPEPNWSAEPEPEPASSISDATTEEDVAFCLMMMSRDNSWNKYKNKRSDLYDEEDDEQEDEEEEDFINDDDEEEDEESEFEERIEKLQSSSAAKYKCETCDKVFKSYQALGGHRASHKKLKLSHNSHSHSHNHNQLGESEKREINAVNAAEKKTHQCPVCLRVFASGQALGGHKRSHVIIASAAETSPAKSATATIARSSVVVNKTSFKLGESLIDLNLPAPDFDDDDDGDETSQVSDAEFVNTSAAVIRH